MRVIVFGLALLVLGAAGVFETKRSLNRIDPQAAAAIQARLDALPLTIGEWVGEKVPYDLKQLEHAKADAHLNIVFRHPKTKDTISMLLLAGPADEIGAHDPNRCYAGAGFQRIGPPTVKTSPVRSQRIGKHASTWKRFLLSDPGELVLDYGWQMGGIERRTVRIYRSADPVQDLPQPEPYRKRCDAVG